MDDDGGHIGWRGWWNGLSRAQKATVVTGATVGVVLVAAGTAYAISHGGIVIVGGTGVVGIGKAAAIVATALA